VAGSSGQCNKCSCFWEGEKCHKNLNRLFSLFATISQSVCPGDVSHGQTEPRWKFSLGISYIHVKTTVVACKKTFELGNFKSLSHWPRNLIGLYPIILWSSPVLSVCYLSWGIYICVCEDIITMIMHYVYWVRVIQRTTPQTDTTDSHVTTSLADHATLLCGSRSDCTDSFVRILVEFQPFVCLEVSCDK
jgi:hypothetical protein